MGGGSFEPLRLVKPAEARGEVRQVYEEICRLKGSRWLGPLFGFFAHAPGVLRSYWELQKQLEVLEGRLPRRIANGIALVCAVASECPRCVNYHTTDLIGRLGMEPGEVEKIWDFENSDLPEAEKAAYRVARKIALNEQMTDEEFAALRRGGFDDPAIVEIVSVALLEGGFARHASVFARFEDGMEWPSEHTPSEEYRRVIGR